MVASAAARSTDRAPSAALLVAWGATLLLSRLPEIILREVVGWDVPWINIVWIVAAAGFIVAATVVPLLRPLRDYFIVMFTVLVLTTVVDPFDSCRPVRRYRTGWHRSPVAAPVR